MLILKNDIVEELSSHAQAEYPKECCGILLGRRQGEQRIATEVFRTGNRMDESQSATSFSIHPLDMVKAESLAENRNLEIVGFYHSHPDHEATASRADALHMIEGYSYPILSVRKGICDRTKSFEKIRQNDTVAKEEILIEEK